MILNLLKCTNNFSKIVPLINNAGSVFCGKYSPESFGDYASGSNHTLPTGRTAKTYSGLSVKDFGKSITFQTASPDGFINLAPTVKTLAEAESLDAHKKAVLIRESYALNDLDNQSRTSFVKRTTNETIIFINFICQCFGLPTGGGRDVGQATGSFMARCSTFRRNFENVVGK